MLVCICKRINDKQVADAIACGATKWHDVHTHHGHKPNCGKCKCEIREAIAARQSSSEFGMPDRAAAKSA